MATVTAATAVAQAAESLTGSSGLLLFLLGGGLIGAIVSAYRFFVNYRTTERGMSRQRIQQAASTAREAQHEASLWQARCGDLTYLLKEHGIPVPPPDPELRALVAQPAQDTEVVDWDITTNNIDNDRRRPR